MNTIVPAIISMDQVPGEPFLLECLQKNVCFSINNKTIREGKLILFRRVHFYIQLALQTDKTTRENLEIPIPFAVENYRDDGLLYFDYRVRSLHLSDLPIIPEKVPSIYFNKILEMQVL